MSLIRRLHPSERDSLHHHLRRLDPESRYDRFCGYVSDGTLDRYCATIDWRDGVVLGWFEARGLRAAVQLVPLGQLRRREAELAVTVEPAWQNRGIGTALCRRALLTAQNRAIARIRMLCLQENARMQRIMRKLRGRLLYVDGAAQGTLEVPPPSYLSLWEEAFGEGGALLETLAEQWRPAALAEGPAAPARARGQAPAA